MAKYIYSIANVPWVNSTVDVWPDGSPEQKTRLVVLGLRAPVKVDERRLIEAIKTKLQVSEVEVESA